MYFVSEEVLAVRSQMTIVKERQSQNSMTKFSSASDLVLDRVSEFVLRASFTRPFRLPVILPVSRARIARPIKSPH